MKKLLLTALVLAVPALAQAGEVYIGQASLSLFQSGQYIDTPSVCHLSHVRVKVRGDQATIDQLTVRFGNGETQTLNMRNDFAAGSGSACKDLDKNDRCITAFYVMGRSDFDWQNANVELYGYQVSQTFPGGPVGPVGPIGPIGPIFPPVGPIMPTHEVVLASTAISDFGNSGYVDVPGKVCGLTHVKVRVRRDQLTINSLHVRFGNGKIQEISLREHFAQGSSSQWKDLAGVGPNARCIDGYYITASGSDFDGKNAIVDLIGYKQ